MNLSIHHFIIILMTSLCTGCFPDRQIRHRACALKDTVQAIVKDELDEDFEKICEDIKESRSTRGQVLFYWCRVVPERWF